EVVGGWGARLIGPGNQGVDLGLEGIHPRLVGAGLVLGRGEVLAGRLDVEPVEAADQGDQPRGDDEDGVACAQLHGVWVVAVDGAGVAPAARAPTAPWAVRLASENFSE